MYVQPNLGPVWIDDHGVNRAVCDVHLLLVPFATLDRTFLSHSASEVISP